MRAALRAVTLRVSFAALAIAVASCALLSPPTPQIDKAVLNKIPLDLPHREGHGNTLLVFPPETASIYDTTQMVYRARAHEVAYFSQHQWGATPSQMLQPLMIKTLENTRYFRAVLTPPHPGGHTYALHTEILELIQDFTSQPATLLLSLRLQLTDHTATHVIATKEISLREPMQQKTPYAGVVAANEATAKALQEVAVFVLEEADRGSAN
jgi:cholesterol transport system auxiliary component